MKTQTTAQPETIFDRELRPLVEREVNGQPSTITDAQRMKWMIDRLDYMEHRNRYGIKCAQVKIGLFWPQIVGEELADPVMAGLSLIEYIDAQINLERKS